jgi:hypothetical protein
MSYDQVLRRCPGQKVTRLIGNQSDSASIESFDDDESFVQLSFQHC